MSFTRLIRPFVFVVAIAAVPTLLYAQAAPAAQTATQFYLAYRTAFDKAKSIDELLPYMDAKRVKEIQAAPATDRAQGFEMMKLFGALKAVKVTKEAPASGGGATLTVQGLDPDSNKVQTGTVKIIRENGNFKIADESWKGSL
jgi:hypothetical protein